MLKTRILLDAVTLARKIGLRALTRDLVAATVPCGMGTVNYHYKNIDGLRDAVIDYAIEKEIIEVLAQARAERHPRIAGRLSAVLKERLAQRIITGK